MAAAAPPAAFGLDIGRESTGSCERKVAKLRESSASLLGWCLTKHYLFSAQACISTLVQKTEGGMDQAGFYGGEKKGFQALLSYSQTVPGRKAKQGQEEISRNHVPTFFLGSV